MGRSSHHPLIKFGLDIYGFFEVLNSKWIEEIRVNNSSHSSHSDNMFNKKKHYVAKFKDVTLEVIANSYELKIYPKSFFDTFLNQQLIELDDD